MYIQIQPGLAIYKQKQSKNWYLFLNFDGEEVRKSLRTADQEQAKLLAIKELAKAELAVEMNIPISNTRKTIKAIKDKVIKQLKEEKKGKSTLKDYILITEKMADYFKNKQLNTITKGNLKSYLLDNKVLSKTRITLTKTVYNEIFDYAIDHKIINQNEKPSFPRVTAKDNDEKDYFEKSELDVFFNFNSMTTFLETSRNKLTKEARTYFFPHCSFLLHSGVRTGQEANEILFKDLTETDIDFTGEYPADKKYFKNINKIFSLKIRKGKTEKFGGRTIPLNMMTLFAIIRICEAKYNTTDLKSVIKQFPREKIFSRLDGRKINYIDTFNQYIELIEEDLREETNHTLYSFRHTTATSLLLKEPPISPHLCAKYLGTSTAMLDKHYSKMLAMMKANELVNIELTETEANRSFF